MTIPLMQRLTAPGHDMAWFEGLLLWLGEGGHGRRTERLGALARILQEHPEGPAWQARIRTVWSHTSAVRLLTDTGLPAHTAFLREVLERLVERFVPSLDPEADLSALLSRLDLDDADARWLETLAEPEVRLWKELLALPEEAIWDAAQLLVYRATALGLARDLLGLAPGERELDSPFGRLPEAMAACRRGEPAAFEQLLEDCRARLGEAMEYLETHGVSSELVYRLDLLEAYLGRLEQLLALAEGRLDGRQFAATLVRQGAEQRSLAGLLKGSLRRLARKVVEHTGQTGEHYLANSRAEWWRTFRSAAGGGALTAVTAALKYGIAALAMAPMVSGLAFAANYSGSFVAMQFAHFTLASKQPAMTASCLAGAMEDGRTGDEVVELVAGITRSQIMATLGNVLVTLPAALALGLGWAWLTGVPLLGPATAEHTLHSLHPLRSWCLPFAALTGVFLWLSSLAAGWAANWSAFRRLPEALAGHRRLLRWAGAVRAERVALLVQQHLSGVVGYLVLGFLLGFMPVLFVFMGLPIEVRHVTLSAASLALCLATDLGSAQVPWAAFAWGLAGIAGIGVLNFSVAFFLSLGTALDARGIGAQGRAGLRRQLWRAFRAEPMRFLGRPRNA